MNDYTLCKEFHKNKIKNIQFKNRHDDIWPIYLSCINFIFTLKYQSLVLDSVDEQIET